MAPAPRLLTLLLAALALAPAAGALFPPIDHAPSAAPVGVPQDLNNVPPVTAPVATVVAFQDERWVFTEGARTHLVTVPVSPTGSWDRIILSYEEYPSQDPASQDPWDRLCSAAIGGVEVLRCTTPRTDFTLTKDVTEFAALMPQGQQVGVTADTGTYAGDGQWVTVKLLFYANEPTKYAVSSPANAVVPAWYYRGVCATGSPTSATVTFPATAPTLATLEITLSGHGNDEFFYTDLNEPVFHVLIDGHEVGQALPMPYTYAFIGFYGADYTLHPYMWWTVQQVTNDAGVYTGVGEIPPYRVTILPTDLPLLTGTHTVTLVGENGNCYWPSSVTFLLH